jgi:hypothetical protein
MRGCQEWKGGKQRHITRHFSHRKSAGRQDLDGHGAEVYSVHTPTSGLSA